jgi:hypothetical protein
MTKVMMTIQSPGHAPDFREVKERYGLADDEIDPDFGVVEVDPADGTYTVLVDERAAGKISSDADWTVRGPYANVRVEPFGPPEP